MEIENAVSALAALAHPHRLTVFRLLVKMGTDGLPAGEISQQVGMSATAASFHLKELDRAGLICGSRDGRHIRYAVHVEGMRRLMAFLTEDCCQARPEICGDGFVATNLCCRDGDSNDIG
jgi:ArsR family transcriptional regulator, arsenate/arsenite/antimonite-responsive transcriptional repressor